MSRKFTRRKFLKTAVVCPALAGTLIGKGGATLGRPASEDIKSERSQALRAAMDEIIPAGDGMPAASEAGGLEYLEHVSRQEPEFGADLDRALEALDRLSATRFQAAFAHLTSPQRIEVLAALETQSSAVFAKLRDHIYESYYTQPKIWKLIGYEFYPTNESGPHMKPFDESMLAQVRKMPKLYRPAD